MSTIITYISNDAASVKKAFDALMIRYSNDITSVLTAMNQNSIAVANADTWQIELQQQVQVYDVWQSGAWVIKGKQVTHLGIVYNIIQAHTTQFEPHLVPALFRPAPVIYPGETYARWRQPIDAEDDYEVDERVTWNNIDWKSTTPNNVWEPGVFGWIQI